MARSVATMLALALVAIASCVQAFKVPDGYTYVPNTDSPGLDSDCSRQNVLALDPVASSTSLSTILAGIADICTTRSDCVAFVYFEWNYNTYPSVCLKGAIVNPPLSLNQYNNVTTYTPQGWQFKIIAGQGLYMNVNKLKQASVDKADTFDCLTRTISNVAVQPGVTAENSVAALANVGPVDKSYCLVPTTVNQFFNCLTWPQAAAADCKSCLQYSGNAQQACYNCIANGVKASNCLQCAATFPGNPNYYGNSGNCFNCLSNRGGDACVGGGLKGL